MSRRRPRIVPSDIKRQTRGFAESPFVIFENLRARKVSHDLLIRGSGCASFTHYAVSQGPVPYGSAPFSLRSRQITKAKLLVVLERARLRRSSSKRTIQSVYTSLRPYLQLETYRVCAV